MIPTNKQLERQIRRAMEDQAPGLVRELKSSGKEQEYVEGLAEEMLDEFDTEMSRVVLTPVPKSLGYLERIQRLTEAEGLIWHGILQTYLEWPEEPTTESSPES